MSVIYGRSFESLFAEEVRQAESALRERIITLPVAPATRANKRSPWDTLHPGRAWAVATTEDAKSVTQINSELSTHFGAHPVYPDLEAVLASFIAELRQG